MRKFTINAIPLQNFEIPFKEGNIKIDLEFRAGRWLIDVNYKDKILNGAKLASGVFICKGKNYPFDFWIDDKGLGIDPFSLDCFERGLFDFYLLEKQDMELIRGYSVE